MPTKTSVLVEFSEIDLGGEMFQEMEGKCGVVVGATSGIGREVAVLLASLGVRLVVAGRREKEGMALQEEIQASGGEALFVQVDVASHSSVKKLIEKTVDAFGPLHFACNNAGIEGRLGPFVEMEEADFDEVIGVNLKGVWSCLKWELPAMVEGGAVVNVSTILTRMGLAGTSLYTASKEGVEGLTRVAAIEHGRRGVRVNAVAPGAVDTPMLHRINPTKESVRPLIDENPLGKIARPEEVAKTVLWLLSSLASHVNGETIFIDGGASFA